MLDQSFSAENFLKILDYQNRKGVYLEGVFFPEVIDLIHEIKYLNREVRQKYKMLPTGDFMVFKAEAKQEIKSLKEKKTVILENKLQAVSSNIIDNSWKLKLNKINDPITGKDIYTLPKDPESFLAIKQVQYCIRKLYKVKQSDRSKIINQVSLLLGDCYPKIVIRTDIKNFYETVPQELIIKKLNQENLLSQYAKKIIWRVFNEYNYLSGKEVGLPRGVGLSAYLAEVYMKDFDKEIAALPCVTYYARYVDDIIVIFAPNAIGKGYQDLGSEFLDRIKFITEEKFKLKLNSKKTKIYDLGTRDSSIRMQPLDFLGYSMVLKKGQTNRNIFLNISLTESKIEKYKLRIGKTLSVYLYSKHLKKDKKQLVREIKFLTSNTRLLNNKSNILTGIYYTNPLLNDLECLRKLDRYLYSEFAKYNASESILEYIKKKEYSFEIGFVERKFTAFSAKQMSDITSTWAFI